MQEPITMAFRSTPNRQKKSVLMYRELHVVSVCIVHRMLYMYPCSMQYVYAFCCFYCALYKVGIDFSPPPLPPSPLSFIFYNGVPPAKKKTQLRLSLLPCKKRAEERRWVSHYEKYIFRNGMKKGFRSVRSPSLLSSPPPSREYWDFSFLLPGEIPISLISFFFFRPPFFYT